MNRTRWLDHTELGNNSRNEIQALVSTDALVVIVVVLAV